MIALTCTSCKKVLEIDDAFSGGVCRCQHCGTIQTVPATLKRGGRPGEPTAATGAKTLYQKRSRAASTGSQSGSGLDDLANAVASSSGLSRGALRTRAPQPEGTATGKWKPTPLLIMGAAIIFVLLIIILFLVIRG